MGVLPQLSFDDKELQTQIDGRCYVVQAEATPRSKEWPSSWLIIVVLKCRCSFLMASNVNAQFTRKTHQICQEQLAFSAACCCSKLQPVVKMRHKIFMYLQDLRIMTPRVGTENVRRTCGLWTDIVLKGVHREYSKTAR
eukprot:scaffold2932_cov139-Skeletonema_marinoi.AAC.3